MKLHLPKLLRSALLAVFVAPAMAVTLNTENIQTPVEGGSSYLNVGMENTTDTWNGDLVVGDTADSAGDVDNVGAFNDSWGWVTPDGGKTNTTITSGLKVSGNLTVQGSGKVVLGGQYKGGGSYTGLEATESITVTGGTLTSTKIVTKNLNVSGGTVSTSTGNCTSGNGYAGGPKQSYIKESLTVSGGSVSFGYTANVQGIGLGTHRMTAFGNSSSFTVNQTGGTLRVYGDMDMKSGSTITQTAGTMVLRDTIYMGGGGTTTITQSGDTSKLVLGRLETTGKPVYSCVFDISQTGAGLIHLAYGSNFAEASTINLTQSGSGTINIGGGHDTGITGALPSRGYELNNSPFEANNTTYNINQTAGTITLKTNAVVIVDSASISGEVNVEAGATLGATYGKNLAWNDTEWKSQDGISAPIVVKGTGALDMASGSKYGVSFTTDFLAGLTQETTSAVLNETDKLNKKSEFDFTVSAIQNADQTKLADGFALIDMDSRLWSLKDGAQWVSNGNSSYVDGTLVYDYWIDVTDVVGDAESTTCTEVFADVSDYLQVGIKVSGESVTLKGNNKHTYGTILDGSTSSTGLTVTLGTTNALGTGDVKTSGTVTLATSGKIVANLPGTITNTGDLTFTGAYTVDADKLDVVSAQNGLVDAENKFVEAASGDYSNCNGFVAEQKDLLLVDQETGAKATFKKDTSITIGDGSIQFSADAVVEGKDVILEGIIEKETATYYINTAEHAVTSGDILEAGDATTVVEMAATAGTLTADESIEVNAKGGTVKLQEETAGPVTVSGCLENTTVESAGGTISADITGTSSVAVTGDTTLSGTNSYSGRTVIDGAVLKLEAGSSVGDGAVELKNHGTFDMGGNALSNAIKVTGCTLRGAGYYTGDMEVHDELELGNPTTANKVTLLGGGSLTGSDLTVNELDVQTDGDASVGGSLTINDNGTITLNNGKVLSVGGSLTLAGATTLALNGEYGVGDKLLTGGSLEEGAITLLYNDSSVELERIGNSIVLVSKFKQDKADIAAQGNWGIATTSRAFVDTVRGQHSNTGCIADGRGTVWAAAFGAYNDLDGSDIDVKGAAVGVDAKVGSCSTVGIAFGYAEGEVSPTGLRDADQEGEYVALYGSHGLKKLSSTSCLSLDWVAAYGKTESEWNSLKWEQDSLQLNTRLNWNKKVTERLGMSVFGGLEYFATGSDTADGVKSGSIQNLRGEIGVGARYVAWGTPASQPVLDEKGATLAAARPGCEKLVLNGEIRYFNDMVRSNPVIEMDGLRGGGENPGRQGMGIEAGATYRISERWSASANYSFNAMEDSVEHRANVGASYTF